jgi:hypothetical protein
VQIPTGNIKATDFDIIDDAARAFLFSSGYAAVEQFISHERELLYSLRNETHYRGFDDRMLLYVQGLLDCTDTIWFCGINSYFLYSVFPSVFLAIRRGIQVQFFTIASVGADPKTQRHETYRRSLLKRMGVQIVILAALPFEGFIADHDSEHGIAAITSHPVGMDGPDYEVQVTKFYSHDQDAVVMGIMSKALVEHATYQKSPIKGLTLTSCSESELCGKLKRVAQYSHAVIGIQNIALTEELRVIQKYVKEFKYVQIGKLISELSLSGVDLFHPQKIVLEDYSDTILTPPIIETAGDAMVVIDGHTRILHCLRNNIGTIRAVVVRNVTVPLPGLPRRLSELTFMPGTVQVQDNINEFNSANFRNIEECVHS